MNTSSDLPTDLPTDGSIFLAVVEDITFNFNTGMSDVFSHSVEALYYVQGTKLFKPVCLSRGVSTTASFSADRIVFAMPVPTEMRAAMIAVSTRPDLIFWEE